MVRCQYCMWAITDKTGVVACMNNDECPTDERVIYDEEDNGYYKKQIRIYPVQEWEQNDGWVTIKMSKVKEGVM